MNAIEVINDKLKKLESYGIHCVKMKIENDGDFYEDNDALVKEYVPILENHLLKSMIFKLTSDHLVWMSQALLVQNPKPYWAENIGIYIYSIFNLGDLLDLLSNTNKKLNILIPMDKNEEVTNAIGKLRWNEKFTFRLVNMEHEGQQVMVHIICFEEPIGHLMNYDMIFDNDKIGIAIRDTFEKLKMIEYTSDNKTMEYVNLIYKKGLKGTRVNHRKKDTIRSNEINRLAAHLLFEKITEDKLGDTPLDKKIKSAIKKDDIFIRDCEMKDLGVDNVMIVSESNIFVIEGKQLYVIEFEKDALIDDFAERKEKLLCIRKNAIDILYNIQNADSTKIKIEFES